MKTIRIELMPPDHHALRVAAATANQTMRQFAHEALLRVIRQVVPAGSGPEPPSDRAEGIDDPAGE